MDRNFQHSPVRMHLILKKFETQKLSFHFGLFTNKEHLNCHIRLISAIFPAFSQVLEQAIQIGKEQKYQRLREEQFRSTSESTNRRVLWWACVQTVVLVCTAVWQLKHLKGFFEAKKLV